MPCVHVTSHLLHFPTSSFTSSSLSPLLCSFSFFSSYSTVSSLYLFLPRSSLFLNSPSCLDFSSCSSFFSYSSSYTSPFSSSSLTSSAACLPSYSSSPRSSLPLLFCFSLFLLLLLVIVLLLFLHFLLFHFHSSSLSHISCCLSLFPFALPPSPLHPSFPPPPVSALSRLVFPFLIPCLSSYSLFSFIISSSSLSSSSSLLPPPPCTSSSPSSFCS